MERELICRMCLVTGVPMFPIRGNELQELYETLAGVPVGNEGWLPTQACYDCCIQLMECESIKRKFWNAKQIFDKMLDKNQPNPEGAGCSSKAETESTETPVAHGSKDVNEPKDSNQSGEQEQTHQPTTVSDVEDMPSTSKAIPKNSESKDT